MKNIQQYIMTVIVASLICEILLNLLHNSKQEALLQIICGLFMILVLIAPLKDVNWELDYGAARNAASIARTKAEEGKIMAQAERRKIITEQLEAYVLEKAAQMDTVLSVKIQLDKNSLPETIELSGITKESVKEALETMIENELGIAKENQKWIG